MRKVRNAAFVVLVILLVVGGIVGLRIVGNENQSTTRSMQQIVLEVRALRAPAGARGPAGPRGERGPRGAVKLVPSCGNG